VGGGGGGGGKENERGDVGREGLITKGHGKE